ncbi:Primary-amine oxidase [Scedosporium apiospermum]|uniref:Amine oxidase n=1 Tax=Pseudallescheria apiosperma TaxID=563466 RepID=A0A084G459_PSEDA|nr:Primary-amine oxidase [Scedosporium apiospermum]KEZ42121.1 Primary-amine oxidase [Scedosporium apiospermum]
MKLRNSLSPGQLPPSAALSQLQAGPRTMMPHMEGTQDYLFKILKPGFTEDVGWRRGAPNPSVCRIFPTLQKEKHKVREALFLLSGILWDADFTESLRDLILGEDNILDSPRNMICLQPGLHRWWHNGYIAFEPVAELSNGVRVRLRWLGVSGLVPSDRRLLDTDPRGCLTTPLESFDLGEYGGGYMTNSLSLGCDCKHTIHYMDADFASKAGQVAVIANAICIHEEDNGIFFKHTDFRDGFVTTTSARKLIISQIFTAASYEY